MLLAISVVRPVVRMLTRMVEQKLPERAVSLFMKACEVAEVGPFPFLFFL